MAIEEGICLMHLLHDAHELSAYREDCVLFAGSQLSTQKLLGRFGLNLVVLLLDNEELHNVHSSPSIIRMIKSRNTRWQGI
jgi:hypothetical protein